MPILANPKRRRRSSVEGGHQSQQPELQFVSDAFSHQRVQQFLSAWIHPDRNHILKAPTTTLCFHIATDFLTTTTHSHTGSFRRHLRRLQVSDVHYSAPSFSPLSGSGTRFLGRFKTGIVHRCVLCIYLLKQLWRYTTCTDTVLTLYLCRVCCRTHTRAPHTLAVAFVLAIVFDASVNAACLLCSEASQRSCHHRCWAFQR